MDFLARERARFRTYGLVALALILAALSLAPAASASSATFSPQATLTASDEIGKSLLGSAVALDRDGDTALIGGPQDNSGIGAAWVFTRKGSKWTEQAKLTGEGEIGAGGFGTSVAISSDGKTALIGAPNDNAGLGAVWIFTRRGPVWIQETKLVGMDAGGSQEEAHCDRDQGYEFCFVGHPADFGASVALSSNGRTAVVGGPGDNKDDGAAWVFTRSGTTWTQQGEKLTGGGEENISIGHLCQPSPECNRQLGGQFGASVALSSDGSTVLIGGPRDQTFEYEGGPRPCGAAWTFTRLHSAWSQRGEKLSVCERAEVGLGDFGVRFGASVALASHGSTALIGAPNASYVPSLPVGLVWAFTSSSSTWTQQGEALTNRAQKLVEYGGFGARLASSANGNIALIAQGEGEQPSIERANAWVFSRARSVWAQQLPPLKCGEGTNECGVALAGDASTALVGTAVYVNSPPHN